MSHSSSLVQMLRGLFFACFLSLASQAAIDAPALMKQGQGLEDLKKYSEAIEIYTKVIAAMPREPAPYANRGWAQHSLGKDRDALIDLETAATLSNDNPFVIYRRGVVRKALNQFKNAAEDFKVVAESDPKDARARMEAAICLHRDGQLPEALVWVDKAIQLEPEKYEYYYVRSAINEKLGNLEQALADCDDAISRTKSEKNLATLEKFRNRIVAAKSSGGSLVPKATRDARAASLAEISAAKPASKPVEAPASDSPLKGRIMAGESDVPQKKAIDASQIQSAKPRSQTPQTAKAAPAPSSAAKSATKPAAKSTAQAPVSREPKPGQTQASSAKGSDKPNPFITSVQTAVAAMPVDGVMPAVVLPPMDLSNVSAEHWAGIVTQVKEGMALIYGEMNADQKRMMDEYWAPYYEFPAPAVLEYFGKLHPLVAEMVVLKEAYGKTAVSCDQAQFHLATALAEEDYDAAVSHGYSFKRSSKMLASLAARVSQLNGAMGALGEPPDPKALKKKARKSHDDTIKAAAIPPASIEGVWSNESLGTWTIQILHKLPKDVLIVDTGDGGRGLMQPFNLPNSWLFIQGGDMTNAEECRYWRLDIIDSKLRVRAYEPSGSPYWYDVGSFKSYMCDKTGPLTERQGYDPKYETDGKGKPLNWSKIFDDRYLANMATILVLMDGELPAAKETSRRREWAAACAESEINDVIEKTAVEEGKRTEEISREKAQGRAFERRMAEQFYYYGNRPPGFDNYADYDRVSLNDTGWKPGQSPEIQARSRRQGLLLHNLKMRLERQIKLELDYVASLHNMKPDQITSDLDHLQKSIADCGKARSEIDQTMQQRTNDYRKSEAESIRDHMQNQRETSENMEKEKEAEIRRTKNDISRLQSRMQGASDREKEDLRKQIEWYRKLLTDIPVQYAEYQKALDKRTAQKIEDERKYYKERCDSLLEERQRGYDRVAEVEKGLGERRSMITSKTVRRLNDRNEFEQVPITIVLAEAKRKVEKEFDIVGYARGIAERLDEELPGTKGMAGGGMSLSNISGDCQVELPMGLMNIRCISSENQEAVAAKPPEPPKPSEAEIAQKKQEEAEALAKKDKIEAFQEEIAALRKSIEGISKTEAEIASDDKDRAKKLEGLARDRMVMEANIKAAEDQIRFVNTGVYQRTRTSWDDYNRQTMMDDSRATANYWEGINRKLDRIDRLIEAAPPDQRDDLRRKWNDGVESAIKEGCRFDKLEAAARDIGQGIQGTYTKEAVSAKAEADRADRNMRIAQGVKTVCDYSLTALTIYATAGLASPASLFMPTCAESAISTAYSITTGYIEGGPVQAFKSAATGYSQAAGLVNTAMESYQAGVLNHLEEHARNPQKVKLDETSAGLSSMGWALGQDAVKQAVMGFVVSPALGSIKDSMKAPKHVPKSGGGIFGPEPIRFKTVNEMKQERLFRDKDIYGKHLMGEFKKAHTDLENARGAGKADFEIKDLIGRAEAAYKAANSNFHAKNWMKRAAKQDSKIGATWCEFDADNKGKVIDATKAILADKGLSDPDVRCYSNSASKGSVGMDMDLGFSEPPRWLQVPDWKDPKKTMLVANPEYIKWRNSLTITDSVTGVTKVISPREYAAHAHEAMNEAYKKVYGNPPDEAFLEFTYSDHPEAYKDMAWLGKKDGPGWADFCKINPAANGQAADVTGFKVNRMQKPTAAGGHDEMPTMPKYSVMLEQARGLVKDLDTKVFGSKADTAAFGNESGNIIKINPESPLGKMPKPVQQHFTELRSVLNDFAGGRITPVQAEQKLNVLTGGQGIVEVPEQLKIVLQSFTPNK